MQPLFTDDNGIAFEIGSHFGPLSNYPEISSGARQCTISFFDAFKMFIISIMFVVVTDNYFNLS